MEEKTPLEKACEDILGEEYTEHYKILSNLLLLNYQFIEKNDPRLSAKITVILFGDSDIDKVHYICENIENAELNREFTQFDLKFAKKLLDFDPELKNTLRIIEKLKDTIKDENFFNKINENVVDERYKWVATGHVRQLGRY